MSILHRAKKAIESLTSASSSDSQYFQTTGKGETFELKEELAHDKISNRKIAVKKVIAKMTVGEDMSVLFMDVLKCIREADMELKKLVYLYIINYAKSQPDLAILAVNMFVRDTNDLNPMIRALAVRTMGQIRVRKISEYLLQPLSKCLKDRDPYVRKTAAITVAKLHEIAPDAVEDQGFLDALLELISDPNAMVVSNAVAALTEISRSSSSSASQFKVNTSTLHKLLAALNECHEWGQVYILDAIALHAPADASEAESIIDRVVARLNHGNPAVVMSAVRLVLVLMEHVTNPETIRVLCQKMTPPLVTRLSGEPEIQYLALRNINLIIQRRPQVVRDHVKMFFCKYNDPVYVKLEKLAIMVKLASETNIAALLQEFSEYAQEVDVEFVRKSVNAIGQCAIKLERCADACIETLKELIRKRVIYVIQESVVVIRDVFRRYPNRYEALVMIVCEHIENLESLDDPEARSSMIWIVGEYADRIDNAAQLLENFVETFVEEPPAVQLQLLTAVVKLFLKKPAEAKDLVQKVINHATNDIKSPDIRDRGYIYWRLLASNPDFAQRVVLAERPHIEEVADLDPTLLDQLIRQISTLSSVYHKVPDMFVPKLKDLELMRQEEDQKVDESLGDLLGGVTSGETGSVSSRGMPDLLAGLDDVLGDVSSSKNPSSIAEPKEMLLTADAGKGMEISGAFARRGGSIFFDLTFVNRGSQPLDGFAIQLNKNTFGVINKSQIMVDSPLLPSQRCDTSLPLAVGGPQQVTSPFTRLDIAVKNHLGVFYFTVNIPFEIFLVEEGELPKSDFLTMWKDLNDTSETRREIPRALGLMASADSAADIIQRALHMRRVFHTATVKGAMGQPILYFSMLTVNRVFLLLELEVNENSFRSSIRTKFQQVSESGHSLIEKIVKNV